MRVEDVIPENWEEKGNYRPEYTDGRFIVAVNLKSNGHTVVLKDTEEMNCLITDNKEGYFDTLMCVATFTRLPKVSLKRRSLIL
jgi:hypothetical protein